VRGVVAALVAALVLAGCSSESTIERGGRIPGTTLSIYSMLPLSGPHAQAARDAVRGQKLALAQSGATAGPFKVNFASVDLSGSKRKVAASVRDAIHDLSIVAAISDLDTRTAQVSVPLFNEAGILQVSPGVTYAGFAAPVGADPDSPGRYFPAGRRTFAPLLPNGAAEAVALARAAKGKVAIEWEAGPAGEALNAAVHRQFRKTVETADADTVIYLGEDPVNARGVVESVLRENRRARVLLPSSLADLAPSLGRRVAAVTAAGPVTDERFAADFRRAFGDEPGPYAALGYRAMRNVLTVLERLGDDAGGRQRVIDTYFRSDPLKTAAEQPFWLRSRRGYEPLS
jgi:branched-chain amino acid transport system substrate-binding protein